MDDRTVEALAAESLDLLGTGRQTALFSARHPDLDLAGAYRVTAALRRGREGRGERPVGRKVGFTNRRIWDEYGVRAPIWGWMYDSTVHDLPRDFLLAGLPEPRIEPEIAFGLRAAPAPGMSDAEILGCVGWVAHGFEIVQSIFPGWAFAAADTVAAHSLHGALLLGPRQPLDGDRQAWLDALSTLEVELFRDGKPMDRGRAANVLDGPLPVLRHLVGLLAGPSLAPPLSEGEIVTTGTVTRAFPVAPGETWSTRLHGIGLPPLSVRFR